MKQKIFAGITEQNELYFLEIEPRSSDHNYFSMSGETLRPLEAGQAEIDARERLEDGELWRMAVESGTTTQGLDDWINEVLKIDGWESTFDLNNELGRINLDGVDYVFKFSAGGQHKEEKLKKYFIPKKTFETLMRTWEQYHLKKVNVMLPVILEQNFKKLAVEAISFIIKN